MLSSAFRELYQIRQWLEAAALHHRVHLAFELLMDEAVGREHIAAGGDVEFASIHVCEPAARLFNESHTG